MLIDTHAHLFLKDFNADIEQVVNRCLEEKVKKIVLPNIDTNSITDLVALSNRFPSQFFPALGLHPCSVKEDWQEELHDIKFFIDNQLPTLVHKRIFGIGEIGLDYYWDTTHKKEQQKALVEQIQWAKKLKLPIILHCRASFDDLYHIVNDLNDKNLSGIFHCFSGNWEDAQKIIQLENFYMGIGGVITFKKSEELRHTVSKIPMEYLMLETDAPYLTPTPFRGKRNESSYLKYIAKQIAEVKKTPFEEIAHITTQNAKRLFKF